MGPLVFHPFTAPWGSGCGFNPAFVAGGSQLLTQFWVGLDEVDQTAVLGAISAGKAQTAGLTDPDRTLGLWATGHRSPNSPTVTRIIEDSIIVAGCCLGPHAISTAATTWAAHDLTVPNAHICRLWCVSEAGDRMG
jgi:hypothetical protein